MSYSNSYIPSKNNKGKMESSIDNINHKSKKVIKKNLLTIKIVLEGNLPVLPTHHMVDS